MLLCLVPAVVHAELQQPSTDSAESMENNIISNLRSLCIMTNDDPLKEEKEKILSKINILFAQLTGLDFDSSKLALVKGNSILCFFLCSSEKQIKQLWSYYMSGLMKHVLEKVFTLLVNNDEAVVIRELQWELEECHRSVQRVNELNAFGLCHY